MWPAPSSGTAARLVTGLIGAVALTALAGGCGDDTPETTASRATPPPLSVAFDTLPRSLDPARAASASERAVAAATQTPLLTYERRADADAAILRPALADALPTLSENETEYRFQLRPGLLYADGRVVTASDVERAIAHASLRAADPEVRDVLAGIIGTPSADGQTLSGVRTDDRTGVVVVRLRSPDGRIPLVLAEPATAPIPELPKAASDVLPASTGPLRVARRTSTSVELVANPLRAQISSVPAARSTQVSVTDRRVTDAALVDGDVAVDAEPQDAGDLPEGVRSVEGSTGEVWSLLLAPRNALVDRSTRRALADAVDRRGLESGTDTTGVAPACGLLPGYVTGSVPRDDCPPAPVRLPSSTTSNVIRLAVPRPDAGGDGESPGARAALAVVRSALGSTVVAGGEVVAKDPAAQITAGVVDAALVHVRPTLPHPGAWLAPVATVDALLAREIPRQTAGPLTGSEDRWSALETRAVDRVVAVPVAVGRRPVLVGRSVSLNSVLVHPVLGLDLIGLRRD